MLVNGIIGKKLGMTQMFEVDGTVVPVTVLQAGPCVVAMLRTPERDGYAAAQLALVEPGKARLIKKPLKGHFAKAKVAPSRTIREFRVLGELKVGDAIGAAEFDDETEPRTSRCCEDWLTRCSSGIRTNEASSVGASPPHSTPR